MWMRKSRLHFGLQKYVTIEWNMSTVCRAKHTFTCFPLEFGSQTMAVELPNLINFWNQDN